MREPTRRAPPRLPRWNDQAAVALLVLVAAHLRAVEPSSACEPPNAPARWRHRESVTPTMGH